MSHSVLDTVPDIKSNLYPQEPLYLNKIMACLPFSASFHFTLRFLFVEFQETL